MTALELDPDDEAMPCSIGDCDRPAAGGERTYCEMHQKRKRRGIPMHAPVQERLGGFERVLQGCIDLADVDTDDDGAYKRAVDNLQKSLVRWARTLLARRAALRRWASSTPSQRSEAARRAALARWDGKRACEQHASAPRGKR